MCPTRRSKRQRKPSAKLKESMQYTQPTNSRENTIRIKNNTKPKTPEVPCTGTGAIPEIVLHTPDGRVVRDIANNDEEATLLLELASAVTAQGFVPREDVDINSLRKEFYEAAPNEVAEVAEANEDGFTRRDKIGDSMQLWLEIGHARRKGHAQDDGRAGRLLRPPVKIGSSKLKANRTWLPSESNVSHAIMKLKPQDNDNDDNDDNDADVDEGPARKKQRLDENGRPKLILRLPAARRLDDEEQSSATAIGEESQRKGKKKRGQKSAPAPTRTLPPRRAKRRREPDGNTSQS